MITKLKQKDLIMIKARSQHIIESKSKQGNLILTTPDTKLAKILFIATEFIKRNTEILTLIKKDQDELGLKKKKKRLQDQRHIDEINELLSEMDMPEPECHGGIQLEQGRPRMSEFQVFIFILIRGYFGSIKAADAYERLIDSTTLYNFFLEHIICQCRQQTPF